MALFGDLTTRRLVQVSSVLEHQAACTNENINLEFYGNDGGSIHQNTEHLNELHVINLTLLILHSRYSYELTTT
jgi:hypothetical protein